MGLTAKKKWYENHKKEIIARASKWAKEHSEKNKQTKLKYRKKRKLKILNYYSNGTLRCACCSENRIEFLTIDHVKGDGAKHRRQIGSGSLYVWLIKNNYPDGFRVLCFNCNSSYGLFGYCPHQKEKKEK
jgi:hypothetical protein